MDEAQEPLGQGTVVWLGVNEDQDKQRFSLPRNPILIESNGIHGDKYRKLNRLMSGHDGGYFSSDGTKRGDPAINHRQITIVDQDEISLASKEVGVDLEPSWLRENIVLKFEPNPNYGIPFSKLPPTSRLVFGAETENPKALWLMEENTPCKGICQPVAVHLKKNVQFARSLKIALRGRRGQMAMVMTGNPRQVRIGDTFTIFPPMRHEPIKCV